jgi:hypothetical protein
MCVELLFQISVLCSPVCVRLTKMVYSRILETFNLTLECHYVYYYLIEHFGQAEVILEIVWYVSPSRRLMHTILIYPDEGAFG